MACEDAGIAVTLPKPVTSGMEAKGHFGKHDFVYLADDDVYRCPAGEVLIFTQPPSTMVAPYADTGRMPATAHSKRAARRPRPRHLPLGARARNGGRAEAAG